jgi:hypothetical protein
MAKTDIEKLIAYSEQHDHLENLTGMSYDTGKSSMVYSRGNILLGKGHFLESLKVGAIRRYLVDKFC